MHIIFISLPLLPRARFIARSDDLMLETVLKYVHRVHSACPQNVHLVQMERARRGLSHAGKYVLRFGFMSHIKIARPCMLACTRLNHYNVISAKSDATRGVHILRSIRTGRGGPHGSEVCGAMLKILANI